MRRFPTDRDMMEHVITINCRVKSNCKFNVYMGQKAKEYCRRCAQNKNGSRMQDYYQPILKDLHYL